MVKGLSRYLLVAVVLLLALLASGIGWLFFTPAGAEAVLRAVSRLTPLHIEAAEIDGRLAGTLHLGHPEVRWPQGEARAQSLTLRWRPLALLRGAVVLERLQVHDGAAHLAPAAATAPPVDFTVPEVGGLPLRLQAEVRHAEVARFTVWRGEEEAFRVELLSGAVAWKSGSLQVEGAEFVGSPGRFAGNATADFVKPALVLDLQATPPAAEEVLPIFGIQADLQPAAGRRQMVGELVLTVQERGRERLRMEAAVDWRPDRIALSGLHLRRPGAAGEMRGEGAVLAAEGWPFDLTLHFAELDLQAETGVRTALFGRLAVDGNLREWRGRFSLANRTGDWQQGEVAGSFAGNPQGIALADLQGSWLQGNVQGTLTVGWAEGWQVEAALAGRDLQPAAFVPEWPGRINFDLQGTGSWGEGAVPTASIRGALRDSTLRGRDLTGGVAASLQGEEVRIDRLDLHGEGFDLHAAGQLQERITFRVDVARLGGLLPQASGTLQASGWGARRQEGVVGEIAARGAKIAWRDLRIESATINGQRKADTSFAVDGDFRGAVWRDYRLAGAVAQAEGTLASHRLQVTTSGADLQVDLRARGGYAEQEWQGELLALETGGRLLGRWLLREPATLRLGEERLQVSSLRLAGEAGEALTAAADLQFAPLLGWVDARWQALDLSRGNPWLADIALQGRSSGAARIDVLPGERLDLRGEVTVAGSVVRAGERLQVRTATARVDWTAAGLQAQLAAELADLGTLSATAEAPGPGALSWPREGAFTARWRLPDLAPLSPWLPEMALAGTSSGELSGRWWDGGGMEVAGNAEMRGQLRREALRFDIRRAQTAFTWGLDGLTAEWSLDLGEQGRLAGALTSDVAAQLRLPETGELHAEWEAVDLAVLRPWLPPDLLLVGSLSGAAHGGWLPGQRLRLSGATRVVAGELQWLNEAGTVTAGVQEGRVSWEWRDQALTGEARLQLAEVGKAEGSFRLPLPARWPLAMETAAGVQGRLRADLQEEGLLNAFFPGLVQESRGKLALDLRLGGTWQSPDFGGTVHLREASAYLPAAGIRLQQMELAGRLTGQQFQIDYLQLHSGAGRLAGEGRIQLRQWRVTGYEMRLRGEKFRAVHLPELQLQLSPDLQLTGTPEKLTVRGEVRIPEMLIAGRETAAPIAPSGDVVIVDAPQTEKRELPLALDVRVRLVLGEHVLVDTEGVDARLEGSLLLTMTGLEAEEVTAQGEIRVAQGKYSTYGVSLDITRGNILFAGGPVTRPTLDIRAMRTVGEVKAGVRVSGTPPEPRVQLVSEPAMADTDILAYIVLGHPLGREGGANAGLLMLAANSLLSKGESAVLQDRLKRTFGLDVLQIDAGDGDVQGSQITIGKYLNPDLYISFGQSLFDDTNEVRMRYNLSRRWQIESSVGEQSAVDLYYKIEFR